LASILGLAAGALLLAATANDKPAALSQVHEICGGEPSLSEIKSRGEALGWIESKELAEAYRQAIVTAAPPDDHPTGEALAIESPDAGFVFTIDGQWMGCTYRDPNAISLPSPSEWNDFFGIVDLSSAETFDQAGQSGIQFTHPDGGLPRLALSIPRDTAGANEQTVGLTILYEYQKESD
jgi:hypothetical protein